MGIGRGLRFKYERLYTFCYFCGLLGHSEKYCAKAIDSDKTSNAFEYGPWLRAPVRRFSTTVGDRWLVKDDPLVDVCMELGSCSSGGSGARMSKTDPKTTGGVERMDQNGMDVDDEEVTISDAKRRRGLFGQEVKGTSQATGEARFLPGNDSASPAMQARHST